MFSFEWGMTGNVSFEAQIERETAGALIDNLAEMVGNLK